MNSKDNDVIKAKYKSLKKQREQIDKEIADMECEYFTEAKLCRAVVYFTDVNDEYGGNPFDYIEDKFPAHCFNVEKRNVMWHDDIDINKCNATENTYASYFEN